jgi:ABC-type antimicrobial peptide transport system permease subunit
VPSYASRTVGSKLVVLLFAVEVSFVTVCVVAGFSTGRRARTSRIFVRCLSVPALVLLVVLVAPAQVAVLLAWVTLIIAMLVVSALSCVRLGPPQGPSDEDDGGGGGGGSGPDRPSGFPEPPRGGAPLPDADPSRVRVRDHSSPKLPYVKRWREREPERQPVRRPTQR